MTRIVCPACSAAYEVPAAAIPPGGRDVQCAACGHNWYQLWMGSQTEDATAWVNPAAHRGSEATQGVAADGPGTEGFAEAPQPPLSQAPDMMSELSVGAGFDPAPSSETEDAPGAFRRPELGASLPPQVPLDEEPELNLPLPPRRQIDPQVLAVLRSEAEVETEARRIETSVPLESQGELPLVQRPRRSASEVRARLAKLQEAERKGANEAARWTHSGDTPADPPEAEPQGAQDVGNTGFPPLPPMAKPRPVPRVAVEQDRADIEPASPSPAFVPRSRTLPAKVSKRELAAYEAQQTRRGFRIGFAVPVLAVSAALALYLAAPHVIGRVPSTEPILSALVTHGDQVQERLAAQILSVFESLTQDGDT